MNVFDQTGSNMMKNIEFYLPLLMVKDFHATGFTVETQHMTNADVAALTMMNLIDNPVNPFTGNPITLDGKLPQDQQYVIVSQDWDTNVNNGKQYLPSMWATYSGDVRDPKNWTFYEDLTTDPPKNED